MKTITAHHISVVDIDEFDENIYGCIVCGTHGRCAFIERDEARAEVRHLSTRIERADTALDKLAKRLWHNPIAKQGCDNVKGILAGLDSAPLIRRDPTS
jgi:hypothetical protein